MKDFLFQITRHMVCGEAVLATGGLLSYAFDAVDGIAEKLPWKRWAASVILMVPALRWLWEGMKWLWAILKWAPLLFGVLSVFLAQQHLPATAAFPTPRSCGNTTAETTAVRTYYDNVGSIAKHHTPLRAAQEQFLPGFLELHTLRAAMVGNVTTLADDFVPDWLETQRSYDVDGTKLMARMDGLIATLAKDSRDCRRRKSELASPAENLPRELGQLADRMREERDVRESGKWFGNRLQFLRRVPMDRLEELEATLRASKTLVQTMAAGLGVGDVCMADWTEKIADAWQKAQAGAGRERGVEEAEGLEVVLQGLRCSVTDD